MPQGEPEIHSFVIKLWLEQEADGEGRIWRGHVTHVPDGKRRYLQRLEDILEFIAPYLNAASPQTSRRTWGSRWFRWCNWRH